MDSDKFFLFSDNFSNICPKGLNWKGGSKNIKLGFVKEKSNLIFKKSPKIKLASLSIEKF